LIFVQFAKKEEMEKMEKSMPNEAKKRKMNVKRNSC
jgi:hypothetical protein